LIETDVTVFIGAIFSVSLTNNSDLENEVANTFADKPTNKMKKKNVLQIAGGSLQ